MRLGIVAYPGLGGSGVVATDLAHRLTLRGHEVVMLATRRPFRLPLDSPVRFVQVELPNYPVFPGPLYTLSLAGALRCAAREWGLELIHTHYAIPHAAAAHLAASGAALVHTLHGTDVNLLGLDPAFREVTALALQTAAGVSAVSHSLAAQARVVYGVQPVVIPNAVDPERFFPRPEGKTRYVEPGEAMLLHASNFRPIKRVPDIVRAFAKVVRRGVRARLVLLGDGPEKPHVERTVRELGVERHVTFLPPTQHPEEVIGAADLFLLHSQEESFGLAALEALASGVPVVAARVGGLSEVVRDGVTGCLVELGDVEAQAEAITALLASPELPRMRRAAREDAVARFHPDSVTKRYEALYAEALARS